MITDTTFLVQLNTITRASNFDKPDLLRQDVTNLIPSYLEELVEVGVNDDVIAVVV